MMFNDAIRSAISFMSNVLEPFGENGIELNVCEDDSTFVNRIEVNPGEYEVIQYVRCDIDGDGVDVKFLNKDEWCSLEMLKSNGATLDWSYLVEMVDDKVNL